MPSVDPSSTTMSSMRSGTASTRRTISSIVVRSLYTGITTDRSGSVLIIGKNFTVPHHEPSGHPRAELAGRRRDGAAGDRGRAPRGAGGVDRGRGPRVGRAALRAGAGRRRDADVSAVPRRTALAAPAASTRRCCCRTPREPRSSRAAPALPERWGYRTDWRGSLLTRAIPRAARRSSGRVLPAPRARARVSRTVRPSRG